MGVKMKGNELVWRCLADSALTGRREWPSIAELAHAAGTPPSTTSLALERLYDIGGIERRHGGGLISVNPEKILILLSAWRNIGNDTVARTTREGIEPWLDTARGNYALGGSDAAITYVSGVPNRNTVASHSTRIVYLSESTHVHELPPGDEVIVMHMDRRAEFDWYDGYTSRAQTYADLFALPGWQAEEFRRALHRTLFPSADGEQGVSRTRA